MALWRTGARPQNTRSMMEGRQIAAVDLGSNSFRLQVARVENGQIYLLDGLKVPVRLAAGIQADKTLSAEAQDRALTALARFGERLRGFSADDVRVVGTNTLRVAHDNQPFLALAKTMLGFPIEIISGLEEARLIYLGAAHSLPPFEGKRLVIDIGGGSTEFIIGQGLQPLVLESLRLGCVTTSVNFFPGGRCDKKAFREAEIATAREVEELVETYRETGWEMAIGTSGTAKALTEILEENNLNPKGQKGITLEGLETLKMILTDAGHVDQVRLAGLRADRVPVMAGGLSIMLAICETLEIEHLSYADGALRQGVLYDLCGRATHDGDRREETVQQLQRRYQVVTAQAERVAARAVDLFDALNIGQVMSGSAYEDDRRFLVWAAQLHEIGWAISHASHHKHGAYILSNADMPGFSRPEQARLAALILGHRGKLAKLPQVLDDARYRQMLLALRLAVLFSRARANSVTPRQLNLSPEKAGYVLQLPADWLNAHPLTHANLTEEVAYWQGIGIRLRLDCLD